MAEIVRKRSRRQLLLSLAAWRSLDPARPSTKTPARSLDFFKNALPICMARWGVDPKHPAMALPAAMCDPAGFERALDEADPAELDLPLSERARRAMPSGALPADYPGPRSIRWHSTLIQACAHDDLWRQAGMLLARGANPNLFNSGVTAVGLAAYVGSARTLAEMGAYGADVRLELHPSHAPEGDLDSRRSTLLHRVAGRSIPNKASIARILAAHERWYPDLLCLTDAGSTPLDWISDPDSDSARAFKSALLAALSEREARSLSELAPRQLGARRWPRL